MLKIKDNVDLKKLEKYGFERYSKDSYYNNKHDNKDYAEVLIDNLVNGLIIVINPYGDNDCIYHETLDVIYDLIKDGLVEKVEK